MGARRDDETAVDIIDGGRMVQRPQQRLVITPMTPDPASDLNGVDPSVPLPCCFGGCGAEDTTPAG